MRNKIVLSLIAIFALTFMAVNITGTQKTIIYETGVVAADSVRTSAWINIGSSQNVAIFYSTDDTAYIKGTFEYRYGTSTEIANTVLDTLSLDTRSSTATGLSKGKVLRGYGLTTDLIPGANQVRVILNRRGGSETDGVLISCSLIAE